MEMIRIKAPLEAKAIEGLRAGEKVFLSGYIYTARDTAHKRFIDTLNEGRKLPFDIQNQVIYYCGPSPAPPGRVIGACGPTTSSRMDALLSETYLSWPQGDDREGQEVTGS